MLTAGSAAPDFILPGTDGEVVREYMLAEHTRDGPVVLAFYLFDFNEACTELLRALRDDDGVGGRDGVTVLGVSRDSAFSHRALAREHDLPFPLLSDSDGAVAERYGVRLDELAGHRDVCNRAVFVVDTATTVRYAWAADDPEGRPDLDEVRAALDDL
ncbi:redoxin domain-containing protein [Halosimplex halophilum]|uniref:redoxin domain-containing protein n=1 Tax=Halosimplex halophilum TaxID=2559572 RepID=UPI00107FCDCD|nr:redoxin domain-containing protein [Halosimplex halophilum]